MYLLLLLMTLKEAAGRLPTRRNERGQTTIEWLGIGVITILVIGALYLLLDALGADVLDWIRDQLGV